MTRRTRAQVPAPAGPLSIVRPPAPSPTPSPRPPTHTPPPPPPPPTRHAEEYAVALRSSLDENDWTKTFELMTELTVLKVDVPLAAQEVAVVSYARGESCRRDELRKDKSTDARPHSHGNSRSTALPYSATPGGLGAAMHRDRATPAIDAIYAPTPASCPHGTHPNPHLLPCHPGGQWQRAEALYKLLQGRGHVAAGATTQELVSALAAAGKGGEAAALLAAAAAQAGADAGALAPAHCVVARALARQGGSGSPGRVGRGGDCSLNALGHSVRP